MKKQYLWIDTCVKGAILAYFLTPVVPEESWLYSVLIGASILLWVVSLVMVFFFSGKQDTPFFQTFIKDLRGDVFDIMILLAGSVTHFVAGKYTASILWLSLVAILLLSMIVFGKNTK